ncbi:LLM class flavin-dependent oxidoreductase [Fructobacillus cardui]|uniref:Luciferase family (Includes alkanesulfonate monooxygenase SsuD and methylene tetrahydromethanopterin reductase) (SsuD) n=1 Tax=Fructobacillus cardui TaxID=2893170 RepID=A0ABM9N2D9_9LACO|nr:Flavin-dependent oxidoreductase [Fructobacillus cardui]
MIDIKKLEFGIETFGDIVANEDGSPKTAGESIQQIVKEAKLADKLNIDVIGIGEHHRPDYSVSAPEMVLSAIATITKKIKLATAVTVLSSDDPVRVYERFATLEAISNGRSQAILGRGSFTESFPLFGYDLSDYEALFDEKIELYSRLLEEKTIDWSGKFTQNLTHQEVYPKTDYDGIETYVGVGGSPESIVRAAKYGFKVIIAIISGRPTRFKSYVDLYHNATKRFGTPNYPIGVHSHGFISNDSKSVNEIAFKNFKINFDNIGKTRGWVPMERTYFDQEVRDGSFYVGNPHNVAVKIAKTINNLGLGRFDLVYGAGNQTAIQREETIELYATKVIPEVKKILSAKY